MPSAPAARRTPPSLLALARTALVAASAALVLGAGPARGQQTYHISASGDDANGCTPAAPCASIARANALDLEPGDSLLFEGGATFAGNLYLAPEDGGTAEAPVVVGSYGAGRATIDAGDSFGIYGYNAGGYEVERLVVVGSGTEANGKDGISFYNDLAGDVALTHLRVDSVDVSGFGAHGLYVVAYNGGSGWSDVRVTNSAFHGNVDGMATFAAEKGAIRDLYVAYNRFYDNPGDPDETNHSGSGLIVAQADGAVVERNLAYGNGALHGRDAPRPSNGPVGIWTWESNDVVIQYNEAYDNRTASGRDGGGFDLDGGVTNSVLQYNYSHGNDGAGYGLFQFSGASTFASNVVRYNVSQNDGEGGVYFWKGSSGMSDVYVYHNVFYADAALGAPYAFQAISSIPGVVLQNNAFVAVNGAELVRATSTSGYTFRGNSYWTEGSAFTIRWGGATYGSLDAWRAATGQETSGGAPTGLDADPLFEALGGGGTIGDADALHTLTAYRLQAGSPLTEAALALPTPAFADALADDFFGNALAAGGAVSIGIHEAAQTATAVATPGWRFLSLPVAATVGDLTRFNLVGGVQSDAACDRADEGEPITLYTGYTGDQSGAARGYTAPASYTDVVEPGAGFFWYFFGSDANVPSCGSGDVASSVQPLPVTLAVPGAGTTADRAVTVDGRAADDDPFYAGGNAFTRAVDLGETALDFVAATDANGNVVALQNSVQVYDAEAGGYVLLTPAADGGADTDGDNLAVWQGAWLERVDAAPPAYPLTLTYAAGAQVTDAAAGTRLAGPAPTFRRVRFALHGDLGGASVFDGAAAVVLADGAGPAWDRYDASKMSPLRAPFAFLAPVGEDRAGTLAPKAAESRAPDAGADVPLAFYTSGAGTFTLTWPELLGFPDGWALTLRDAATGAVVDLRAAERYTFESAASTDWDERFTLAVHAPATSTDDTEATPRAFALSGVFPNPSAGDAALTLELDRAERVRLDVFDLLGRRVARHDAGDLVAGAGHRLAVPVDRLAAGSYVVRVTAGARVETRRFTLLR